jgi:hypothetical protein
MDSIFVELFQDSESERLELPSEYVPILSIIPHFRSLYGTSSLDGKIFGSAELPIRFTNIASSEFIRLLELLKLKYEHTVSFQPISLTFSSLLKNGWKSILLPTIYLTTIESLSEEELVTCMCVCMKLSLYNLCKLIICRILYIINTDHIGDQTVTITKYLGEYTTQSELILYYDMCRTFIMNELDQTIRSKKRSLSF